MTLTTKDLQATLDDDRHQGFGYAGSRLLTEDLRAKTDFAVVARANALGMTYEDLFAWSNSKLGRWLADDVSDRRPVVERVAYYLSAKSLRRIDVIAEIADAADREALR